MKAEIVLHANLTNKQKSILKGRYNHAIIRGPAGTSKTYIALARGLELLRAGKVDKIVIIRSAVEIRSIGFLPGDPSEKMDVYTAPYDVLMKQLSPKNNFRAMAKSGHIEFLSTSYLRGVTWDDSYVLVDEYQNMNKHELDTIVTRVGNNTHLILCGDSDQTDLKNGESKEHNEIISILERMSEFTIFEFTIDDIVRSAFVKSYYRAKDSVLNQKLPKFVTGVD